MNTKIDGNIGVSRRRRCAIFSHAPRARQRTDHGVTLLAHLRALKLPAPLPEYRFHPTRMWRFDFAWPDRNLAVEIEGGVWIAGAHTRGAHFESDCEKYANAMLLNWRVLRITPRHIKDGRAVNWIAGLLAIA